MELSLHFYNSTYSKAVDVSHPIMANIIISHCSVCMCSAIGASGDVCEVYGGQCVCNSPSDGFSRITGQRCDNCPFQTYLTPNGCADCDCPNPTDTCSVSTGQCPCPPLVTGRRCDTCTNNSFGDPLVGCSPCTCDPVGTQYCTNTTGECM